MNSPDDFASDLVAFDFLGELLSAKLHCQTLCTYFLSITVDVNFLIRDLSDVKMSPFFSFPLRFWTFQNFDPEISATFSEIFWTERGKFHLKRKRNKKFTSGCQ